YSRRPETTSIARRSQPMESSSPCISLCVTTGFTLGPLLVLRFTRRQKRPSSFCPPSLDSEQLQVGAKYSRSELAQHWGYASFQPLARGVATPRDDNKIILFVTHDKQTTAEPYQDELGKADAVNRDGG